MIKYNDAQIEDTSGTNNLLVEDNQIEEKKPNKIILYSLALILCVFLVLSTVIGMISLILRLTR